MALRDILVQEPVPRWRDQRGEAGLATQEKNVFFCFFFNFVYLYWKYFRYIYRGTGFQNRPVVRLT